MLAVGLGVGGALPACSLDGLLFLFLFRVSLLEKSSHHGKFVQRLRRG